MKLHIDIERTRKGFPAIWESGGGYTNTGNSRIIANPDGSMPTAIYIRRRGHRACGDHALIPIRVGMWVIDTHHHRGDFHIAVSRIEKILSDRATLTDQYVFKEGKWDNEPPSFLEKAIESAKAKAQDYHCRVPYFVKERDKNE